MAYVPTNFGQSMYLTPTSTRSNSSVTTAQYLNGNSGYNRL